MAIEINDETANALVDGMKRAVQLEFLRWFDDADVDFDHDHYGGDVPPSGQLLITDRAIGFPFVAALQRNVRPIGGLAPTYTDVDAILGMAVFDGDNIDDVLGLGGEELAQSLLVGSNFYLDTLCLLAKLGVQVSFRSPFADFDPDIDQIPDDLLVDDPVPRTGELGDALAIMENQGG